MNVSYSRVLARCLSAGLITALLAVSSGFAQTTNKADRLPIPSDLWFDVGEELIYRVYWGKIPVGTATVKSEWTEFNGRRLIAIRYRAISNKVLSKIYPVDSSMESLIDPETFKSVRFTKNLREGRHRYHEITDFNYDLLTANWTSVTKDKTKQFKLEPDTRDLVAFLYAMRAWPFKSNETWQYRVMADDDIYDVWMKVRSLEKIVLPEIGPVESVRIEPEAAFNGMFVRKGKLTVWVSNSEQQIMTKIVASLPVVNVNVLLWKVNGPGGDTWLRKRGLSGEQPEADIKTSAATSGPVRESGEKGI